MTKIISYSDGGSRGNPGPSAIGVLICNEEGTSLFQEGEVIGETTNNVAEYRAVLKALTKAEELGASEVSHHVDSQLVERQLKGQYRLKAEHLKPLFLKVKEKEQAFDKVSYTQVPRENPKIKVADSLVNQALDRAGF